MCYMHPYLILLNLISLTIFGEEYRSLSSKLLCSFLHSPFSSSLLVPHMILSWWGEGGAVIYVTETNRMWRT
jgi:hypothetical protein